jgi:hypothetical protein
MAHLHNVEGVNNSGAGVESLHASRGEFGYEVLGFLELLTHRQPWDGRDER